MIASLALWALSHITHGEATAFSEQEGHDRSHWACASPAKRQAQSPLSRALEATGRVFASRDGECWHVRLIFSRGWLQLATRGDYGPGSPSRVLDLLEPLRRMLHHNGAERVIAVSFGRGG